MGKIIFYEDRNFKGKSHECSGDNADLHTYFARCNSILVENGCWVIYERSNYMGHQYYLKSGEYPDYQSWLGLNDSIRSCHSIPNHHGSYRIRLYEREDFRGQMKEYVNDCSNVYESFHTNNILSCSVVDGYWIFFEEPGFKGNQYFLKPGEYRRCASWGSTNSKVGSLKKIAD